MRMPSTQGLAVACARHPWRTVGAWLVVLLLALASIALFLGSALVTVRSDTGKTDEATFRTRVDALRQQIGNADGAWSASPTPTQPTPRGSRRRTAAPWCCASRWTMPTAPIRRPTSWT